MDTLALDISGTGLPAGRRCLVGVSGGCDSVVLLHALLAAGFKKLIVCHLDHGLRKTSRGDARFVQSLCRKHGLLCVTQRKDVAAHARQRRISVETAGRELRYQFFAATARASRCRTLVLGHHADDRVETLLFNLFRGAGPAGLASMRAQSERTIAHTRLVVIRPLLKFWRSELRAYALHHRLKFREDPSNRDVAFQRNNIRHRILPEIERLFGREVRQAIWRTAEILAAEEDWIQHETAGAPFGKQLQTKTLRTLHLAPQRRLIHAWLQQEGIASVGFAEIERVRALLGPGAAAKANLPLGRFARRRSGLLFLE